MNKPTRKANAALQHFLLVFDHDQGKLVEELPFGQDSESALAAYSDWEKKFAADRQIEVVLVGSDSIDTVRITHANYFDGTVTLERILANLGQPMPA